MNKYSSLKLLISFIDMTRPIIYIFLIFILCLQAYCENWSYAVIGDVTRVHYYWENDELKGICTSSDDGVIAMLDPVNGEILWRNYPPQGRIVKRFIAKGRCNIIF